MGRHEKAISVAEHALRVAPQTLMRCWQRPMPASLCRRAGETQAAAAQYAKLAAAAPAPRIQRKQAFILAKTGRENEAIPLMEELLRADPRDFYVHTAYEAACRRAQQLERARKFYQDLLTLHPDEKSLHGRLRRVSRTAS